MSQQQNTTKFNSLMFLNQPIICTKEISNNPGHEKIVNLAARAQFNMNIFN